MKRFLKDKFEKVKSGTRRATDNVKKYLSRSENNRVAGRRTLYTSMLSGGATMFMQHSGAAPIYILLGKGVFLSFGVGAIGFAVAAEILYWHENKESGRSFLRQLWDGPPPDPALAPKKTLVQEFKPAVEKKPQPEEIKPRPEEKKPESAMSKENKTFMTKLKRAMQPKFS